MTEVSNIRAQGVNDRALVPNGEITPGGILPEQCGLTKPPAGWVPLLSFTAPGKPSGFLAKGEHWSKQTAISRDYAKRVRGALQAHMPDAKQRLRLAQGRSCSYGTSTVWLACWNDEHGVLVATKERPLWIDVASYYPSGNHADSENTRKLIVDSFFYIPRGEGPKGNTKDKHVGGTHTPPQYDKLNPRAEIFIYV